MKLLMLSGLPASGKTTYAKELCNKNYVRVNKDDMRDMLHAGKWSKANEKQVLRLRDKIIEDSLYLGKNVVVDDTNLAPKHLVTLRELAKKNNATFEVKFFFATVEDCIKRDLARPNSVGHEVIEKMYNDYLAPKVEPIKYNPTLPYTVLCDIDGTLAHMKNRGPYDWFRVDEDAIDETVADVFHLYIDDYKILLSGRSDICRQETEKWLEDNNIKYDQLFMRKDGDNRKDNIVKKEIYEEFIKDKFNVRFVLDDRDQVVKMWRSQGLKCLQVADGNF